VSHAGAMVKMAWWEGEEQDEGGQRNFFFVETKLSRPHRKRKKSFNKKVSDEEPLTGPSRIIVEKFFGLFFVY
jgi:hypothetical protein